MKGFGCPGSGEFDETDFKDIRHFAPAIKKIASGRIRS
jgi:hypothetical protein